MIGPLIVARAGIPECVSWTGCSAQTSCWHHLTERPRRVTALCEACGKAGEIIRAKFGKRPPEASRLGDGKETP